MGVKRYKAGKLKGEITTAEIRKLIRAHNKASSIKIPPKSTREDIIGILQKAGYSVNHEKAELRPVSKGKVQKLKVVSQQTIQKELPKPKTKLEKQKAKEEKEEKQMQKKKQERAERKEIVQKALKQQEKTISKKKDKEKDIKDKNISNIKKKMPDASTQTETKKLAPAPKTSAKKKRKELKETQKPSSSNVVQPGKPEDVKIEEANRQIIITEGEKNKKPEKETKVPINKLFDRVVSIVEKGGYKMTDKQKKEVQENHINNFLLDSERGKKSTRYYIFKGKGETDMLILSPDDRLGGGLASIRIKKEEEKKEEEAKKKKKIIKKPKAEPLTEEQEVKRISDANVKNAKEYFEKFFVGKLEFFDDKVRDQAIKDGIIKSNGDLNLDAFALDSRPNYMATLNITNQRRGKGKYIEGTEGGKQGKEIPYLQIVSEYKTKFTKDAKGKKDRRTNYRLKKIEE